MQKQKWKQYSSNYYFVDCLREFLGLTALYRDPKTNYVDLAAARMPERTGRTPKAEN